MTDLSKKCLIDKDTVKYLLQVIKVHCESYTNDEQKELEQALNQDLSGRMVVPVEPTSDMLYEGSNGDYHAEGDASDVYKAMLYAAPKLGDTKE